MSTVVHVVVVAVMVTMMIMIKVFGCWIEKTVLCVWSALHICKRRIVVENPFRKDRELIVVQGPERKRSGGIGSCILTFDPRVLFTGVLIQRMEAHFGSYRPR